LAKIKNTTINNNPKEKGSIALNERTRSEITGKASEPYHSEIAMLKPEISSMRKIKREYIAILTKI
jgi:hypothetical protein